jgi:hypothetical protein
MSLVDKMASIASVNNYGWRLLKQSDGHFWFCLGAGPGNGCDSSVSTTVNGLLEGSSLLGDSYDSSDVPVLIGANSFEGAYLVGEVAQVQLFKSALSAPRILAAFASSKGRYGY